MKNKMKKSLIILLTIALAIGGSGCGKKQETKAPVVDMPDISFPLEEPQSLTYWAPIQVTNFTNFSDMPLYQELEKRTGVKMEYIHPARGQEADQLNIMIAANELPDIIEASFARYPGGGEKAVKSGILAPLNDYMDKYAPNYKKVLESDKNKYNAATTSDGTIYRFNSFQEKREMVIYGGPIVRGDFLEELGMDEPVTIDDWYEMLKAFKNIKGVEYPFVLRFANFNTFRAFMGAYGVCETFYHDGDEIKFGPTEEGYKEFLKTINKWYKEDLIDPDFATIDSKITDAKLSTGKSGASFAGAGGGIGRYTQLLQASGDGYFIGVDYPVLKEGQVSKFGQGGGMFSEYGTSHVSAQCKNIPLAVKWLDYGYSEEGNILYNFGLEGISYDMIDGYPTYSEEVRGNPEGLSKGLAPYGRGAYNGPFVQDIRYIEQYFSSPDQRSAWEKWQKTEVNEHTLDLVTYTEEESAQITSLKTDINTYISEMTLKFMIGVEPIEKFDEYVAQIEKMGINEWKAVVETAYKRFKNK